VSVAGEGAWDRGGSDSGRGAPAGVWLAPAEAECIYCREDRNGCRGMLCSKKKCRGMFG
jgi:hypothetical protein